ncbi:MAG: hypothetical protein LBG19_00430 [Prevotellaceae bacterium]|jgi:hypothetical protein|nr:hypothetical protein [Prevotellaceae bacterium]
MKQGKNSIKRYILITAVVAIWAIVVYKIIDFIKSDTNLTTDIPYVQKKIQEKSKKEKNYTLLLSYSDPFLKESWSMAIAVKAEPLVISSVSVMWPLLKYNGYLKNGKSMIGILELNGNHQSVKKGDIVEDIKVIEIYEDSILLKYKDDLKTFLR